jgi:hypothetical protein
MRSPKLEGETLQRLDKQAISVIVQTMKADVIVQLPKV